MPHGRMVNLVLHSPASQIAILGSLVSVILTTSTFFYSYSILGASGAAQSCHEIKAIAAFSFLTWILRNSFLSSILYMPLTV